MDQGTRLTTYIEALLATDVAESSGGIYLPTETSGVRAYFHGVPTIARDDQHGLLVTISDPNGVRTHYKIVVREVGE